jgi:hypothetical protein
VSGAQFSPDGADFLHAAGQQLRQHVWVKELAGGQEH